MGILLAFAPFIMFAVVDRLAGGTTGLIAGAAVSAGLILRDCMTQGRSAKILEIGTAILFGGLAIYALLLDPAWSIMGIRLRVDAGLLLIVLVSIALQKPFTLQYAREQVPQAVWSSTEFIRTNYVITAVWALAFVVMVGADLTMLYATGLSPRVGIIATILAIVGAYKFTSWYPERRRAQAAT